MWPIIASIVYRIAPAKRVSLHQAGPEFVKACLCCAVLRSAFPQAIRWKVLADTPGLPQG